MKIYAISICVEVGTRWKCFSGSLRANNKHEAYGLGIESAFLRFPEAEGYGRHAVTVSEIPFEWKESWTE